MKNNFKEQINKILSDTREFNKFECIVNILNTSNINEFSLVYKKNNDNSQEIKIEKNGAILILQKSKISFYFGELIIDGKNLILCPNNQENVKKVFNNLTMEINQINLQKNIMDNKNKNFLNR